MSWLRLPRTRPTRFRAFDVVVLIAAALLVLQAPLSVAEAGWVPHLESVPRLALGGLLVGYLVERTRLPAPLAYLLAILLGVEAVTAVFADVPVVGTLAERVDWLGGRVGTWLDTVSSGGVSNDPLVFALAMGGLAWLLGLLTAWLVFRDHAPWLAIVFNGAALLMNLSYASTSLVGYVGWFAFAACLVLAAHQLAQRQELWRRAQLRVDWRIALNVLLGTTLAAGALLSLAWAMPSGVTSPEVTSGWARATTPWHTLEREFDRWFASLNGSDRTARGLNFGRTLAPRGSFDLGDTPVLEVTSDARLYLRATTADRYAGQAITSSDTVSFDSAPNTDLLFQDEVPEGRAPIKAQIRILASRTGVAFAPDAPLRFSVPTLVDTRGRRDDVATIHLTDPLQQNQEYTVVSAVSAAPIADLRTAGEDYPGWVRDRYLQLPRRLPRRVVDAAHTATLGATSAYDKAAALESYLRNSFTYSTHVPVVPPDRDWVDYFLFDSKQGYCDYFATAMVVLLRVEGVPARVASGFAPGDHNPDTGTWLVRENHAHSWVEVYFPRYGWVTFEPSAIRPLPERLDQAPPPAPSLTPAPADTDSAGLTPDELDELRNLRDSGGGVVARPFLSTGPGMVLLGLGGLLAAVGVAAAGLAVAWRRGLGGLAHYQQPYAQLVRLSRWLGALRPRPADTPYELADALARQVPTAGPAIEELADAYVEGTYAPRPPRADPWPTWLSARRQLIRELVRKRLTRDAPP